MQHVYEKCHLLGVVKIFWRTNVDLFILRSLKYFSTFSVAASTLKFHIGSVYRLLCQMFQGMEEGEKGIFEPTRHSSEIKRYPIGPLNGLEKF